MSKFKKGDRVRVIEHEELDEKQLKIIGEIGKVKDVVYGTVNVVEFDDNLIVYFCDYKLERVEHQYKVGDKVVLLGTKKQASPWEDVCRKHNIEKGDIVTIDIIDIDGDLKFKETSFYCFSPEDVKRFEHNHNDLLTTTNNEVNKMELKNTGKGNRKEALKQYKEEKANAEVEYCKEQLRIANNEIDAQNRLIKRAEETIAEHQEVIDEFKA